MDEDIASIFIAAFLGVLVGLGIIFILDKTNPFAPLSKLQDASNLNSYYTSGIDISTDNQFYWSAKRLERILGEQLGATVVYGSAPDGVAGMTDLRTREVLVNEHFAWTARFETLAHEAAHLLQPSLPSRMDGEAFAESVACVVALHDGDKDALRRSAHYLAGVKAGLPILTNYRTEILRAAAFLE